MSGEHNRKLSFKDRKEIFALKGTTSGHKAAKQYGVSHTTVYRLWGRKPPASHEEALKQIKRELEKNRGMSTDVTFYNMWVNIDRIIKEALSIE